MLEFYNSYIRTAHKPLSGGLYLIFFQRTIATNYADKKSGMIAINHRNAVRKYGELFWKRSVSGNEDIRCLLR